MRFCSCLRRRPGPTSPGRLRRPATGRWRRTGAAGVPTSSDNADIFNGGTATITTTGDVCSNLSLGNTTGSGTIQMTGGSLTVSDSAFVGYSGTGNFTQSGGTNTISIRSSTSATTPAAAGPTASAAPGSCPHRCEYVGYSGTGNFTQSGGTNTISSQRSLPRLQLRQQRDLQPQRFRPVVRRV